MPSHLVVNQWVRHEAGKPLTGTFVIPQSNGKAQLIDVASIAIVGENGQIRRVETTSNGEFSFDDVTPGIYALTARGKNAFSIVALHVIDATEDDAAQYPTSVEMPAARIDYTTINAAIVRYLPPAGASVPTVSVRNANFDDLAKKVLGTDMFRVAQSEGGMKGRIYTAGANEAFLPVAAYTNVFITKDGEEVARTVSDDKGFFAIDDLAIGEYSLLAVGPGGLSLVGFELVNAEAAMKTAASLRADGATLVAQFETMGCGCVQEFEIQCAPMPEVVQCVQEVVEAPCCGTEEVIIEEEIIGCDGCGGEFVDGLGAPIPGGGYAAGGYGGGYGGGGFGGGGGGGFGGGLGGGGGLLGLAAIGGIAAAGIAAADNNDNNNFGQLPSTGDATPGRM